MRAFVTDIDGTLTDETQRISPIAIKALRRLEAAGIRVILASGNALPVVKTLKRYLGCTGAVICENGAVVEYRDRLETLGDSSRVKLALARLKGKYGEKIAGHWSNQYRLIDTALKRTVEKEQIEAILSEIVDVQLVDSGFAYHITSQGVNKGEGLKIACKLMRMELGEITAMGDSETDIELLKVAGLKIAVANAPPSLKQIANHITKNPNGAGVAEASDLILSKI